MKPYLIDTTLRDGMQAPGVVFTRRERLRIASLLDEFGIDEIEAGVPAMGMDEQGDIMATARLRLSCRLTAWCRADKSDIEAAERCKTDSVHISFPVSKILLDTVGKNEAWLFSACETLVSQAAERFAFVSVGGQDATRASAALVRKFAAHAAQCGAKRFRIADTVGIAAPMEVAAMVRSLKRPGMPQIEFHGHNDLGMASANAVTALFAGANAVSVTVNGFGERAGNAALEEVVMALRVRAASQIKYNVRLLPALCKYVASAAKRPLCFSKPVVGEGIFEHESGIHCDGLIKNPKSFQPFLPQEIGRGRFSLKAGYHSGSAGIRKMLADLGERISSKEAKALVDKVKGAARRKKGTLTNKELLKLLFALRG